MAAYRVFVGKLPTPPRRQAIDTVIDALSDVWNRANDQPTAERYLVGPTSERAKMIYASIWRYQTADERQRVALLLLQLADAIYSGAVAPWVQ